MYEQVVEVRDRLAELVDRLDPDRVTGSAAGELFTAFQRVHRLAAAGMTLLARRVADTHRPDRSAAKTAAEQLARQAGTSTGQATDAVTTSHHLPDQPALDQALRRSQLSAEQAVAISDATAADPAAEQGLVEYAGHASLKELREECLRTKAAADPNPDATYRRLHAQRRLRRWTDAEGGWNLAARGTPEAGAAFSTALDPIINRIFQTAQKDGRREPHEAYSFDALIHLAEHATGRCTCTPTDPTGQPANEPTTADKDDPRAADGSGTAAGDDAAFGDRARNARYAPAGGLTVVTGHTPPGSLEGADTNRNQSACPTRPGRTVNPRYLALLRIDVEALRRGQVEGDELCEITGISPVPVSVARGLLGDAILKLVITSGVGVANITHLGRGPTAAQRAALLWTNPTCAVQGCNRTRVEIDHTQPWAQTRHTRLDELDPLCEFHHDLKTRHDYALVPGAGKRPFVQANDPRHPNHRPPGTDQRPRGNGARSGPPDQETVARGRMSDRDGGPAPPSGRNPRGVPGPGNRGTPTAPPPGSDSGPAPPHHDHTDDRRRRRPTRDVQEELRLIPADDTGEAA